MPVATILSAGSFPIPATLTSPNSALYIYIIIIRESKQVLFQCVVCFFLDTWHTFCSIFALEFNHYTAMKIKLTEKQIKDIVANPEKAAEAKISVSDPWWLIVVKVIAYICGLIIGGAATTSCVSAAGLI